MRIYQKPLAYDINDDGCHVVKSHFLKDGYARARRTFNGESFRYAHRWIAAQYLKDYDKKLQVCHKCDNPSCINPVHLFMGTQAENNRDRHLKGRTSKASRHKGSENPCAKINLEDAIEIRILKGMPLKTISKNYGISISAICDIQKGRTWN